MATPYLEAILSSNPTERATIYATLNEEERSYIVRLLDGYLNNPYLIYEEDPVGFIENGLHETLWTKQKEIVEYCEHNDMLIRQLEKEIENNKKQAQLFINNNIKSNINLENEIVQEEIV